MSQVHSVENKIDFYSPIYQQKLKSTLLNLSIDFNKVAGNGVPVSESKISEYLDCIQNLIPLPEDRAKRTISDAVKDWVLMETGNFTVTDVYRDLKIIDPDKRKAVLMALNRLKKDGLVVSNGEKRGNYRIIEPSMKPMNWESCDVSQTIDFKLPLGLHKYMYLYPRNLIVIAGDTNAGKTAYLLNAVRENANEFEIDYFTNDLTEEELKKRVDRFAEAGMDIAPFSNKNCHFIGRTRNYLDVMDPDKVTIIDYLSVVEDAYKVANVLDDLYNKLRKGIAIVAIQKKIGQKLGRGGDFAMERPRLYFTLEKGRVYIMKMKNLIDPNRDPNGKCVKFSLWGGCKFVPDMKNGWQNISKKTKERQPGEDDNLPF